MICYDPFWLSLKRTGITQYELIYKHNVSRGTLYRMKKNLPLTLVTIDTLCNILKVPVDEVVEIRIEDPPPG